MIKESFIVPIYNCQVDCFVTDDVESVATEAGFNGGCIGYEGLALSYPSNPSIYCLIFKESTLDEGVIAHEGLHLTSKIMEACDVKYDPGNMEAFCYLHGYIIKEISKIVTPGKAKKKKA